MHNHRMALTIEGKTYELVKEQRGGLSVYRGEDSYARVGAPESVARTIATHRKMEHLDFPVARTLSSGSLGDSDYTIEQSLGTKTFRTLFEEDIIAFGSISEDRFNEFIRISKRYLQAQSKALVLADSVSFARGIHLDIMREELPHFTNSLSIKFDTICERLTEFPYVFSHGDFNAANILPLGVIDLEDTFSAPFGFDAASPLSTIDWFPSGPEYEYFARYRFSAAQREAYFAMCDEVSRAAGFLQSLRTMQNSNSVAPSGRVSACTSGRLYRNGAMTSSSRPTYFTSLH